MTGAGRAAGGVCGIFAGSAKALPGSMSADAVMISKRARIAFSVQNLREAKPDAVSEGLSQMLKIAGGFGPRKARRGENF